LIARTPIRFLIRDHDPKFTSSFDSVFESQGTRIVRTPIQAPEANAFCERLIATIRRECLDWLIVLNERHLRFIQRERVVHYNQDRPHASLGPGIPDVPREKSIVSGVGPKINGDEFCERHHSVGWTADGHLRHAAFLGLRTDKSAAGVRRET
jgi:hypothetical protein